AKAPGPPRRLRGLVDGVRARRSWFTPRGLLLLLRPRPSLRPAERLPRLPGLSLGHDLRATIGRRRRAGSWAVRPRRGPAGRVLCGLFAWGRALRRGARVIPQLADVDQWVRRPALSAPRVLAERVPLVCVGGPQGDSLRSMRPLRLPAGDRTGRGA